jgi:hypothetical protein
MNSRAAKERPMTLFPGSRPFRPALIMAAALLFTGPVASAAEEPPQVSPDGLELVKRTKSRVVYVRPGADLSGYRRVAILDCEVQFEENWQDDYNRSQRNLQYQVRDSDVERMKTELASECKKVFAEEMSKKDGYEVVEVAAPDVLILRPGLVNVEVYAPDLRRNVGATIVRSAGQMTLFLELWDSTSSTLLARVLDVQADNEGMAQRSSRVTNKAAADRILKDWAQELRRHLEAAQGQLTED